MLKFVFNSLLDANLFLSHMTIQSKGRENKVIVKLPCQSLNGNVTFTVSVYCYLMKITGYLDFQEFWNPPLVVLTPVSSI